MQSYSVSSVGTEKPPLAQLGYERVIDCLEDEKEALTLAMAERLRDYQELVRVKTGLSLEVATYRGQYLEPSHLDLPLTLFLVGYALWTARATEYVALRDRVAPVCSAAMIREPRRALLEGESNPEILIWTEHIEDVPQDFRNTSYRYTDSVSQKNERNLFPKQKAPFVALNHSSTAYSNGYLGSQTTMPIGNTARRGFLASRSSASATTRHKDVYEKTVNSQTNFQTFSPTRGLVRNTNAQVRTFPDRAKTVVTSDAPMYLTKGSTVIQESCRDRWDSVTADASESTRSNERTIILQKKIEAKATREQESDRSGPIKMKPEEKMFDSKEKASEERNLRWEELTKLDKEARKRESQQMRGQAKGQESLKEKTVKDKEIPISLEVSQGSRSEVSPKDIQTPRKKAAGDITYYVDKELPGEERTTKTEIVVESKLTEDIDVSDEASLEYLLSKDVKEVGLKGKSAEQMIGDIINLGLKGREGRAKVVNVEIVEEPMSYVGGRKTEELSSPFQVEEVDDVSPGSRGLVEEEERDGESHVTFSVNQHQRTKQPGENVTHAEEVSEAGDSERDQSYFVSTPDELPAGHDREDEGSVYGQIHIEEESTIRYSWQDEIVQGTWRRRQRDSEAGERDVQDVDVPAHSPGGDMGSAHWKEEASGEFHAEPTVIEKEIKIPHELHTSIRDTFSKEPREQLAEVIGKLEETLPERMKAELSTLTREGQGEPGSVSVDVKKLQTTGGSSVTLVAEVNLSQTVDADQLDLEGLSRDEADEIEKAVESVVRESLSKRQGQAPGSPDREDGGVSFKRWATRELYGTAGEGNDAGQASGSPEEPTAQGPVSATVEVSSPRGFMQSHVLEDLSQSVRHIRLGPTEVWRTEQVPHRGPTGEVVEVSEDHSQAASVRGASQCARHFTVGPSQSQVPTQVIFQGPDSAWQEAGGTEEPGLAELSADTDRGGRHSTFGAQQFHAEKEISFQGPVSGAVRAGDYFATKEPVSSQISVWHLQLSPKEGLREQIQFIVPPPDKAEGSTRGGSVHTAELPGPIDIRPQGHQATEQVVPQSMVSSTSQGTVHREGSTDVTQATHSYTSGRKILMTEKSTFQRVVSESPQEHDAGDMSGADMTSGVSRSFRHIQLGPTEARTSEHIVIHGPMFRTFALAGSQEPAEIGELADSSRTLGQLALGPKETSFTFQMDVSSRKAAPTWTQEAGTEAEAHSVSDHGAWRDAGSRKDWAAGVSAQASASDEAHQEEGTEQARFDKTVQLQRMVDQRSVISDEKKVALLYLDSEEEEGDGQWF
ncbi:Synemin [Heterocephalus glaber]|uniref:Synemin n=1 Tax=Heterocephalus glaber TaxID=10181 RepID=G5ARY1_HETGA|nr:Synemin [Heterocephalus glaber]